MTAEGHATVDARAAAAGPASSATVPRGTAAGLPAPSLQRPRPSGRARAPSRQPIPFGLIQEFRTDAV